MFRRNFLVGLGKVLIGIALFLKLPDSLVPLPEELEKPLSSEQILATQFGIQIRYDKEHGVYHISTVPVEKLINGHHRMKAVTKNGSI